MIRNRRKHVNVTVTAVAANSKSSKVLAPIIMSETLLTGGGPGISTGQAYVPVVTGNG